MSYSYTGVIPSLDLGDGTTWDGTEADALANGWTVNGNPNTVAELRTTPPQVLGMDFNQYRWFNGVDSAVTTPTTGISELDLTSSDDFEIECSFIEAIGTPTPFRRIISLDSDTGGFDLFLGRASASTELGVGFAVIGDANYYTTTAEVFSQGVAVHVKVVWNGGSPTIYVDGVSYPTTSTANWSGSNNSSINIGAKNVSGYTQGFNGVIYNARINNSSGTALWCQNGYGKTPWADTIGSNDGTESGTFENVLVSDYGTGTDALGNAITPRTNKTFNADESGYTLTPDDDSLDVTTEATWVFKGNFYPQPDTVYGLISKDAVTNGTRSWNVTRSSADVGKIRLNLGSPTGSFGGSFSIPISDAEQFIVFTYNAGTVKGYVDGVEVTVTNETGSAPTSLFVSTTDVRVLQYGDGSGQSKRPISDVKIYNRALTSDEIAKFS